ncbi:MAG: hypothetical protein AB2693_14210, partial [Candidatus Thiodiazotropha sp.]
MRKIDEMNAQIQNAWGLRVAKPAQTPRDVSNPWGKSAVLAAVPPQAQTFTQDQLLEATATARHETQKATLQAVADMLGSLGIMTTTGQTLTSEIIRQRVKEMYPGLPNPDTSTQAPSTQVPQQPEAEQIVIPDTQESVIPDSQENPDVQGTPAVSVPDTQETQRTQGAREYPPTQQESRKARNRKRIPSSPGPQTTFKNMAELPVSLSPRTLRAITYSTHPKVKMGPNQHRKPKLGGQAATGKV